MAKKEPDKVPDVVRVEWSIATGFANATHSGEWEIDRAEWDDMSEAEREEMLEAMLDEELPNYISTSYEVIDG